jgi:hypothetical protein
MTLLITTRQTEERGNGSQKTFYFNFPVLNASELYVRIRTDGSDTITDRTDYSITGLGNDEGGYITFTGAAPLATQIVNIQRWVENTQTTDYVENDPFPADTHEDTADRMVMMIQQTLQFEGVGQPGHCLMWDSTGQTLINGFDADDIAYAEEHAYEATTAWSGALEAEVAAYNWAAGTLNTNFTYGGKTGKSAYHWATVAMVYTVFDLGTKCWFGQLSAPTGWTIDTAYNDCLVGVRSTTAGATYYASTNPWTERNPAGAANNFYDTATDSDGSFLVALVYNGRLYKSEDYGSTWSEIQPVGNNNRPWAGVDVSSTGQYIIACSSSASLNQGRLYTSANYGANWTERQPDGNADRLWRSVCMSDSGAVMYACVYQTPGNGKVWKSIDYGVSWSQIYPKGATTGNWISIDCDSDGSNVIICEYSGTVYTSTDYGATWSTRQPAGAGNAYWFDVASDSTGTNLMAVINNYYIYTSSNGGANWTAHSSAGARGWRGLAMSDDGSIKVASVWGGRVYLCTDGSTWTETRPTGTAVDRYYYGPSMDSTGAYITIGVYSTSNGYIYTYGPIGGAAAVQGSWTQETHTHTQPTHTHTGGTISVTLPAHSHIWHKTDKSTYDASGNLIDIGDYKSSKTTTGLINEVTKANSRTADADFYTSIAGAAGGSASGSTGSGGGDNTLANTATATWRPSAACGIVATLTTIPTA